MVNENGETSHAEVGSWRYIRHSEPLSNLVPVAMVLLKSGCGSARNMKDLFYSSMTML